MPPLSTSAIILATYRYGESSKIIRLATESAGVQSAIAKGAMRPKSRFGAALQVLSDGQAHLIVHANRELQLLTAFDLHRVRVGLARGMERYAAASALSEVMLRFGSGEGHLDSYQTLRQGLDALEMAGENEVEALGISAMWGLVSSLGFEPTLHDCVKCGGELATGELAFDPAAGGALCVSCSRQSVPSRLSPEDRSDLVALVQTREPLPPLTPRRGAAHRRLLARYIQYHLGEGTALPALDFSNPPAVGRGVIIGMGGHIDHGKSSLVEALTGTRMDRLKEERDRGITIELNFAPLDLGDGRVAGVVDVPGHEDFVRTMVAGASGIDLLLLVIAADEGIKPQTREHLAIAEQLTIARGIAVITKADLVDPEWVSLVELEVTDWLKGSPIAFESPRVVSVLSRQGLDDLLADLRRVASSVSRRSPDDFFRLPVDRSFSVAGIGTVVTGTAWSGTLAPGDQVLVLPARRSARVRTIQVHGQDVAQAEPGMRVALGLAGVAREEVGLGDTIVEAGPPWAASLALDVNLSLLPGAPRALISRARVRLHLGTSEVIARVYPRGTRIEPGSSGLARLALESPAVARGGDRFVIRGFSPVTTIGGGRVIDPLPPRRKAAWPPRLAEEQPELRMGGLIERRPQGVAGRLLPILLGTSPALTDALLRNAPEFVQAEEYWVGRETLQELRRTALASVQAFHQGRPDQPGIPLAELRQVLHTTPWLAGAALLELEKSKSLVLKDGVAQAAGFHPLVQGGNEQVARVVDHIRRAGLAPPSTTELTEALGVGDLGMTLRLAAREGLLEGVERDRYYARESLEQFVAALVELGKGGSITPARLRERLGISRKFLIPLLEWADARAITIRETEGRRLRAGHQLPWTIPAP